LKYADATADAADAIEQSHGRHAATLSAISTPTPAITPNGNSGQPLHIQSTLRHADTSH